MAGNKLTDTKISKAKAKANQYKLFDGGGLHLIVTPAGGKFWRWSYRFNGTEQLLSVGEYPLMSLSAARAEHQRWQKVLSGGLNPAAEKKKEKEAAASKARLDQEQLALAKSKLARSASAKLNQESTIEEIVWPAGSFGAVQAEWFVKWSKGKSSKYVGRRKRAIDSDILPQLGYRQIADIEAPHVVQMATKIESRDAGEMARRALMTTGQIFRFAIAKGYTRRNPAADFNPGDVLKDQITVNHPRVEASDLPKLLLDMENYSGTEVTRAAMWIMSHTFLRTAELTQTPWTELDLDGGWWKIPKERMKMPSPHIVPLSRQMIKAFRKLRKTSGDSPFVFPGAWDINNHMGQGTILNALYNMGYHGVMSGHGYRGVASTILHEGAKVSPILREDGYPDEWIEIQLAHLKRNKTKAAYDHSKYLSGRKAMMQDWSDFLDEQLNKAKNAA